MNAPPKIASAAALGGFALMDLHGEAPAAPNPAPAKVDLPFGRLVRPEGWQRGEGDPHRQDPDGPILGVRAQIA